MFWQAEKGGSLGAGTARKRGVLGAGPTRKKGGGVLGAGQVKKGGSLPRHIPILNIYVSTPPPPGISHAEYYVLHNVPIYYLK